MGAFAFAIPILPGKSEMWRQCMQEIQGSRHREYEESRQRLGISREKVYFRQTALRDIVIVCLEVDDLRQAILSLTSSELSFDRWLKRQILDIHGLDLSLPLSEVSKELIFTWQTSV